MPAANMAMDIVQVSIFRSMKNFAMFMVWGADFGFRKYRCYWRDWSKLGGGGFLGGGGLFYGWSVFKEADNAAFCEDGDARDGDAVAGGEA